MMKILRILLNTVILQMKSSFARSMFRFCLFVCPIGNTILIYYMFINSGSENFTNYVLLGAGLMGLWTSICFSSAGDINRERWMGTLSIIYSAPSDFRLILWGKIMGNTILSMSSFLISLLTLKLLFQAQIVIYHIYYFILTLLIAIVCFMIFSVLISYLLTMSRKTSLYMNCIDIPITLLCGFVFPIDYLPKWAQAISNCLPPTWAVRLMRLSIQEKFEQKAFYYLLCILIIISICYLVITSFLYRIIDRHIRVKATLEVN